MKKKIILAVMCLLQLHVFAQQKWDLKECIDYGLQHNRNTAVYENEKKAADAKAKEALSDYLPKVSVSATLEDNLKVQESVIPAGVFGPTDIRVAFSQKFNSNGLAQLDQTIYDQSLLNGLKANKYSKQQAGLNIVKNQETIIYNIGNAYYQIIVYREQLRLLRENLETYQKQIDISALQVKKGVTLKKDLDKVTVDYNNAVSQIRVAESNLTLAENQLKYEMGYPMTGQLQVENPSVEGLSAVVRPDLDSNGFLADKRTDYQLSMVNAKLLEIDQKRIKAGALPKLSGYARYGAVGFGNTLGPAFKDLSPYSVIGLKLSIPLFDFFKRNAQYNQAKYKSLNAVENLKLDEGKYEMEYQNARTKMVKAKSSLESDRRNIDLAQSVFKITDLQYKKGVENLTEWLNTQNSIKEAQNNYLNSLYSFLQARLDLEKAAGSLKTFYTSL
ncbi:outer membrane protein TolC [Pedobacter cryoconitis]|uniref:Outer membrane protein TolC n=1 Tax=Pedobacter cryoconitis TaxID=188932 RepID=A0A7W9DM47_9SPHI|nr:TolC family protein [Pedobacter cryoconitis]MBB5623559.1 outer membrane protein TolC [Pedobacter cryoconitis]MBB5645387.1 outer membrane protein TolC [Pedobacter cryoconitis]